MKRETARIEVFIVFYEKIRIKIPNRIIRAEVRQQQEPYQLRCLYISRSS